jgi:hypothetical protein
MRKLSQTPSALAARRRRAAERAREVREARERYAAHLAAYMVVRADGSEVLPGDVVGQTQETTGERRVFAVTFLRLSRAPGDGTGTNGKIIVNDPTWISDQRELYPSVFGLDVRRRPGATSPYDPSVPADFPVRPLGEGDDAADRVTCGTCGRSWDDAVGTSWTPAPSGRCPFEYFH